MPNYYRKGFRPGRQERAEAQGGPLQEECPHGPGVDELAAKVVELREWMEAKKKEKKVLKERVKILEAEVAEMKRENAEKKGRKKREREEEEEAVRKKRKEEEEEEKRKNEIEEMTRNVVRVLQKEPAPYSSSWVSFDKNGLI